MLRSWHTKPQSNCSREHEVCCEKTNETPPHKKWTSAQFSSLCNVVCKAFTSYSFISFSSFPLGESLNLDQPRISCVSFAELPLLFLFFIFPNSWELELFLTNVELCYLPFSPYISSISYILVFTFPLDKRSISCSLFSCPLPIFTLLLPSLDENLLISFFKGNPFSFFGSL